MYSQAMLTFLPLGVFISPLGVQRRAHRRRSNKICSTKENVTPVQRLVNMGRHLFSFPDVISLKAKILRM